MFMFGGCHTKGWSKRWYWHDRRDFICCHREKIRSDIALTGEVTLSGDVLAIGDLKEKLLAALKDKSKR